MRYVVLALLLSNSLRASQIEVPITDIFVPSGFDDNDNAEVVVSGYLPTPCYQDPSTTFSISGSDIVFTTVAESVSNGQCPIVTVPYSAVISLGKLKPETYNILAKNVRKNLKIESAPNITGDNFYYANVEKVYVSKNNKVVKLLVRDMSSCLIYDRMGSLDNGSDVISLLPIFEFNYGECKPKNEEKMLTFNVPKEFQNKPLLVHIRSMNGHSKNVILHSRAPHPGR